VKVALQREKIEADVVVAALKAARMRAGGLRRSCAETEPSRGRDGMYLGTRRTRRWR